MAAEIRKTAKRKQTGFDQLNGWHSWQDAVAGSYVMYPVRKLNEGEVLYFNFTLAEEMGLIAPKQPHVMTKSLRKEILETFSIRIINEYDQKQNIRYHPSVRKPHGYMATRYLQLQHADKTGRTSGDGRSIWNGEITHEGITWDLSSRGTGVTCLSPGAVEAQKPLKSGSTKFGYGCGMADIDELLGAAIMAEIFHNSGLNTERVLCVIDLGDGNGIGVRAGKNLFRPAHLFLHLKQGQLETLRKATDYFIERQHKNGEWRFHHKSPQRYDLMLENLTQAFARFAAQLDREYIFAWLDWDGDNVLANAGIIDYGSIRQFGLRHDEYRYDDVDRFSTSLREQKKKTRSMIQTFAQMVDFLKTGRKKRIEQFRNHWSVLQFEKQFTLEIHEIFLKQMGLPLPLRQKMLRDQLPLVERLYRAYSELERQKTHKRTARVPDGLNRPAIFNMRSILTDLPKYWLANSPNHSLEPMPSQLFFDLILAKSARGADRTPSPAILSKIKQFQLLYMLFLRKAKSGQDHVSLLRTLTQNAARTNRQDRLTGDGLLYIVDEILAKKKRGLVTHQGIQALVDRLIDEKSPEHSKKVAHITERIFEKNQSTRRLYHTLLSLVDDNKESI